MNGQSILRAIDRFAPSEARGDTLRRSRLIVLTAFGLVVFGLPLMLQLYLTTGYVSPTMWAFGVGAVVMLANPWILRRTGSVRRVGILVCGELLAILCFQTVHNGGLQSASLIWSLVVPPLAMFLVGTRFGLACSIVVVLETVAFWAAGQWGYSFPRPLSDVQMHWWHMAGLATVAGFLCGLTWLYEVSRRAAQREVGAALDVAHTSHREMEKARDLAEQSAAAKTDFLANMSHEIRTPMNAVVGMTSLLLETKLDTQQRDYVGTVRASSEALLGIVNDILDFSKIDAGQLMLEKQPFDVRTCVEDSLTLVAPMANDKKTELAYVVEHGVPWHIISDPTRLLQILVNLLGNAIKFTDCGEVTVIVEATEAKNGHIELRLVVRDTGIGIPAERLDDLFDPFTQADSSTTRRYGGTGLGLAITSQLVRAFEGTISVESVVGSGTSFAVTIPAEVANDASPDRVVAPELEGRRVLIVDDNPISLRFLELQTQELGMTAITASSAEEAMLRLNEDAPFDVAVLDVHMPDVGGLKLAEMIRSLDSAAALPLLVLSAVPTPSERLAELDIFAQLTKPCRRTALRSALDELLSTSPQSRPLPVRSSLEPGLAQYAPLRLLVAEDNVVNQKVVLAMLHRLGYRADVVSNGAEAVKSAKRQRYDLVFMDVQMPEMDGVEATRVILDAVPNPPTIVAMTANAREEDRRKCLEAGMHDFISKPIRPRQLRRLLSHYGAGNETTDLA